MAEPLMVLIGCDCDPDRPRYGGVRYDERRAPLKWDGVERGIRYLRESLERVAKNTGIEPKIVFCVRSDMQMAEIYGSASWSVSRHSELWRTLERGSHEIAWHPHLWRWSEGEGCWRQETRDTQWIEDCLEVGFSGFTEALGESPATCHMGWTFHNNTSMSKISRLGVRVDFSASPGVFIEGRSGDAGSAFDNYVDWQGSPLRPFHPSKVDYRRPAKEGEEELPVFEIPKFTIESPVLKKAKDLLSGGKVRARGAGVAVFLQATVRPLLYRRFIKERLESAEAEPFFCTYFHPDELLPARPRSARGFLYVRDSFEKNLVDIINTARQTGRDVRFVTGKEAFRYLGSKGG